MNKEFLRFQVLSGIIAESEYKAKLEENVDANAASEEAKELLKDPKEMADIEAELGSLSESEGEEKRTKLQTALRLAGYGAIAGLLGTVPLAALAGASLKAILLAAAAGKLGGAATALTVGLAGEKEQRESLNENFVGMGMVGNIFDREKTDYELAFEHFTKSTSILEDYDKSSQEMEEESLHQEESGELEEGNGLRVSPDNAVAYLENTLRSVWNRGVGKNDIDFQSMAQSIAQDLGLIEELEEANPLEGGPGYMTKEHAGVLIRLIHDLENEDTSDLSDENLELHNKVTRELKVALETAKSKYKEETGKDL